MCVSASLSTAFLIKLFPNTSQAYVSILCSCPGVKLAASKTQAGPEGPFFWALSSYFPAEIVYVLMPNKISAGIHRHRGDTVA